MIKHSGGCHCGRVRFEVLAPAHLDITDCNCSMCSKTGYQHLIVPKAQFTLLQGSDQLTEYTFNTGVAKHFFVRHAVSNRFTCRARIPIVSASMCVAWMSAPCLASR